MHHLIIYHSFISNQNKYLKRGEKNKLIGKDIWCEELQVKGRPLNHEKSAAELRALVTNLGF